jgi:hypothetical protein
MNIAADFLLENNEPENTVRLSSCLALQPGVS